MDQDPDDMKLPALREVSALAEYVETPGSELMGFLTFFRGELLKAIEILREETQEQLADGDAFERIQAVNRLRLRRNRLEAHLMKEVKEVRDLAKTLLGQADRSVVDTLNNESRNLVQTVRLALKELTQEFGVE